MQPMIEPLPEIAVAPVEAMLPAAATRSSLRLQLLAVTLALLGGLLGAAGAVVQEAQVGGGILLALVAAPVIEEALKPAGIYLILIRWPQALLGRWHTALLTGMSGLAFGLIESFVYVKLYFPDHGDGFVLYRFTVPVLVHFTASFIVGMGLSRGLIDWAAGRSKLPKQTRMLFLSAVLLHAVYNVTAVILAVTGILDFDEF
jgi:RsiW-degrading membrane proteinase PrsW (M82 family)